jgi:ribonuclease T1
MRLLRQALLFLLALLLSLSAWSRSDRQIDEIAANRLPPEAQQTLMLIKQGKPLPYAKDGAVFGNYEGVLPKQKRGYYHEYTVKTPGAHNRGARRIIVGGAGMLQEYFYTDDHYVSFKRIRD